MSQQIPNTFVHTLPTELLKPVVYNASIPVIDDDVTSQNSALHGMPDLSFIAEDPRVLQIQNEEIIPETLIFVVHQKTCDTCNTHLYALGNYISHFNKIYQPPSDRFIGLASRVDITIRCGPKCGSYMRDTHTVAFYSKDYSLSLMVLSRIAMLNSQRTRYVDISCVPRSHVGASKIMEFLKAFSDMTYGLARGNTTFATDAYSPIRFLEVIDLVGQLERPYLAWGLAAPSQQTFLREAQRLLDGKLVPIHKMATVGLAGYGALEILHNRHTPTVNQAGYLSWLDVAEFTMKVIFRSSFALIIVQGLARRLLQQDCKNEVQDCAIFLRPETFASLRRPLIKLDAFYAAFDEMTQLQPPRKLIAMMWRIEDLPYLMFVSAVCQSLVLLRIALLRACRNGRTLGSVLHFSDDDFPFPAERSWRSLNALKKQIDALVHIDNEIKRLRQQIDGADPHDLWNRLVDPPFPLEPHYDHIEVEEFVAGARRLAHLLDFHEVGYFNDRSKTVDTDVLFQPVQLGLEVPRIPMITDWPRMGFTFDLLNSFKLLQDL